MKLPHRRQFLHLAAGAAALPAVSRIARAQAYPSRPITIIAPFPAGGATDIVSRTLAEGMKAPLGQTIQRGAFSAMRRISAIAALVRSP